MNRENKARLMQASAMAIFGTLPLFVRNISVSSGELALYRAMLASLIIGIYLLVSRERIPVKSIRKDLPMLLISGVAMGFTWILLFEAYKYTTVSVATLSYYFSPVIITLACPLIFREKLTRRQFLCFAMSTVGIVMITGVGEMSGKGTDHIGILFGLAAAVLYAFEVIINKMIRGVSGIHRTFLQFLAAIAVLIPYVAMTSGVTLGSMNAVGWINLLVVGFFHTGITYCMYFSSLQEISGQKAAILSYIDPLVAVILSVTVLGERMTFWQAMGGAMVLSFTLWNELTPQKK